MRRYIKLVFAMNKLIFFIIFSLWFNPSHSLLDGEIHIRKNARDMTKEEWNFFNNGIKKMKEESKKNFRDPATGYTYQAYIHGYPDLEDKNTVKEKYNWHQCQHGHYFFLPWHRMYLYFFEKILRYKSGDETLTIPYWDYYDKDEATIPEPFRNKSYFGDVENHLYSSRCHSINNNKPLPFHLVNHKPALSMVNFTDNEHSFEALNTFGGLETNEHEFDAEGFGALENLPHNQVHLYLGGQMANNCNASLDPIFWLHHAQIDRLWETWNQIKGHENPIYYPKWMNQKFTFYDKYGKPNTTAVKDILDIKKLNYRYDELANIPDTYEVIFKNFQNPKTDIIAFLEKSNAQMSTPTHIIIEKLYVPVAVEDLLSEISQQIIKEENIRLLLSLDMLFTNSLDIIYDIYLNSPIYTIENYTQQEPYYYRPLAVLQSCETKENFNNPVKRLFDVTSHYFKIFSKSVKNYDVNITLVPLACDQNQMPKNPIVITINNITLSYKLEGEHSSGGGNTRKTFGPIVGLIVGAIGMYIQSWTNLTPSTFT